MVKIEVGAWQPSAAILASVIIARIDIESRKADVAFRHSFVGDEQQHSGNAHEAANHADTFVVHFDRQIAPAIKIECAVLLVNRTRNALVQECKGALNRSYVNRKVRAIEHQDLAVEQGRA